MFAVSFGLEFSEWVDEVEIEGELGCGSSIFRFEILGEGIEGLVFWILEMGGMFLDAGIWV
jgi:hypothetical protein